MLVAPSGDNGDNIWLANTATINLNIMNLKDFLGFIRCNNLWIMYTNYMPTYLSQINQSHGSNSVNLDITAQNAHQNEEERSCVLV